MISPPPTLNACRNTSGVWSQSLPTRRSRTGSTIIVKQYSKLFNYDHWVLLCVGPLLTMSVPVLMQEVITNAPVCTVSRPGSTSALVCTSCVRFAQFITNAPVCTVSRPGSTSALVCTCCVRFALTSQGLALLLVSPGVQLFRVVKDVNFINRQQDLRTYPATVLCQLGTSC